MSIRRPSPMPDLGGSTSALMTLVIAGCGVAAVNASSMPSYAIGKPAADTAFVPAARAEPGRVRIAFGGERRAGMVATASAALHPATALDRPTSAIVVPSVLGATAPVASAVVFEPVVRTAQAVRRQPSPRVTTTPASAGGASPDVALAAMPVDLADDAVGTAAAGREPAGMMAGWSDLAIAGVSAPDDALATVPAVAPPLPGAILPLAGSSPAGAGLARSAAAVDTVAPRTNAAPRQTARGIEFEVAARFNGRTAGRISLLLEDSLLGQTDRVSDNISVRLGDLVEMFHSRIPADLLDRLGPSGEMQRYVTLNDLRSNGISVSFDDKDRLVFGTM